MITIKVHITGLQGAGKTIFANWLAQRLAREGHVVSLKDGGITMDSSPAMAKIFGAVPVREFNIQVDNVEEK